VRRGLSFSYVSAEDDVGFLFLMMHTSYNTGLSVTGEIAIHFRGPPSP